MTSHAEFALEGAYAAFGRDAFYEDVPCRVINRLGDAVGRSESLAPIRQARLIEVRVAEVAKPIRGGVFLVGGEQFKITADPRREDPDRLVWTCEVKLDV